MKIVEVEGIVISDTNYSESSKILNVLTKEYGLIGIISKGCRKTKSKLRGVSNKMIYGKFNIYYKEGSLSTLISVDLINSYTNIITSLTNISYASLLIELINQVVKENNEKDLFDLIISALNKIDEGYNPLVITNIVELKCLEYLGVMPNLDECALCGNKKNIITIDASRGGYVCNRCYTNEKIVSEKVVKLLRMYYYVDISKISKLDIKDNIEKEINEFLEDYYDRYTGIYLKSKNFMRQVNKLDN